MVADKQSTVIKRNPLSSKIENVPVDKLAENFVARHFKQIFIASVSIALVSVLFAFITVHNYAGIITNQNRIIANLSNKVIFVRPDGRVAVLDKEPLSHNAVKYILRNLAINYVPLSAYDINGNASTSSIIKVPKVAHMLKFLSSSGINGYRAYIDMVLSEYKAGTLPEVIVHFEYNKMQEKEVYRNGHFMYSLSIPIRYLYVNKLQWNEGKGKYKVRMSGTLDLAQGTPENPFGVKIDNFEVTKYISKPFI